MPADTKAIAYEWFMTTKHDEQIVKFRWEPEGDEIVSSMTSGRLVLWSREELAASEDVGVYGEYQIMTAVGELPWVVAERFCRDQGFVVEEPIYS